MAPDLAPYDSISPTTDLYTRRFSRRSVLQRAGLLGVALPMSGALLAACGGSSKDDDQPIAPIGAATTDTNTGAVAGVANTGSTGAVTQSPTMVALTVTAKEMLFEPATLVMTVGTPVELTFHNAGVIEHDWVGEMPVVDLEIVEQPTLTTRAQQLLTEHQAAGQPYAAGNTMETMVVRFTPSAAGEFPFACLVPGHRQGGMVGTVTVAAAAGTTAAATPAMEHGQTTPTTAAPSGTPVAAERLPKPRMMPPVGTRGPQRIKIDMEVREVVGYLDEGVAFEYWTFDGTVPGTMLRVRVGDTVDLTLTNPAESLATHNIDLHAVTGPGGGAKATTVAPGETKAVTFKAMAPGVYVYHCAVAPIPHHISAGMFGLIVVEPEGGLPPVDREFYVMQSDLYLEGNRGDKGLRTFSNDKNLDERPEYVVFNGHMGALTDDNAFTAEVGDTVRIFFGVGGPNLVSSFHVIGEIFDRVMPEGASEWHTNVQTTLVPAGGATVVEFTVDVPGTYIMVDHSLGRMAKGAMGLINVTGDPNPEIFDGDVSLGGH